MANCGGSAKVECCTLRAVITLFAAGGVFFLALTLKSSSVVSVSIFQAVQPEDLVMVM